MLEKELVYEEVSNLAEKLRSQALDGRKSTLEIAEKINEYKARTTDLSRKMLATVSELSMFQSKALKMQQEKDEKERIIEEAMQRLQQGMPPTDTADSEWEKIERKRAREVQDREERIQRKILEQQLPNTLIKTNSRPNSYMPADICKSNSHYFKTTSNLLNNYRDPKALWFVRPVQAQRAWLLHASHLKA